MSEGGNEESVFKESKREEGKATRSWCCCCCKRPAQFVIEKGPNSRNGARLAMYATDPSSSMADNLVTTPTEDHISDIQTFRQDCSQKDNSIRRRTCEQRCKKCCKKFMTFFFSNIGLCSLVVAYSILGGFIFQTLEAPHEIQKRHLMTKRRALYAQELWNFTDSRDIFFEPNYTRVVEMLLVRFQTDVLLAKKDGWDGSDGDVEPLWSFAGSLLYSVTVITTIGRLVTIFYALFGIPLTLLCLTNMGSFLGNCFRLLYKHLCQLLKWMCCPPEETVTKRRSVNSPGSTIRSKSVSSRSDLSQQQELHPLQLNADDKSTNTLKVAPLKAPIVRKDSRGKTRSRSSSPSPTSKEPPGVIGEINIVVEDYDNPKMNTDHKVEQIRVPIFVSLLIIAIYIIGGALMFSMWENWDYLEGSYFCFITLSTIGFGDYVPGSISRTENADSRKKLIICCVYLLFGLAVIAMCFNLMQEDVRAKFRWLGVKLGLIEEK
ncbi:KCNKI-like protein [Mya arenaria]|uniref:KCNKI-like protein n=1 Tax=Mya arenaria TaxID=6604 RepID=A0ABY7DZB0_MYAAR|nr:KCNKI-like protein [Mya arenaria]